MKVGVKIRDYDQLRASIAARRRALGMRQLEVDEKSGLQSGYAGKIEAGVRRLGPLSLPMLLAALDCDLVLLPRSDASPVERRETLSASSADRFTHHQSETSL